MAVFLHLQEEERHNNLIRRNRIFRDRLNPLDAYDDLEIKLRYRLTREMIMDLYDMIGAELEPATMRNHAIPGMLQIFCALRFYASGSFYAVLGDSIGIHKSTVSRIVHRVTLSLCRLSNRLSNSQGKETKSRQQSKSFTKLQLFPISLEQLMAH